MRSATFIPEADLARETLREILALTHESPEPRQAIFDLDSTLFCVSYRTQKILRELGNTGDFSRRFPRESEVLKQIEVQPSDWGIRSALIRSQLHSSLEFFEEVRKVWVERFFSNDYLKYDQPYEGAVEFLQALHQAGVPIRYLTGRDRIRMGEGTVESLKQWKFPLFKEDHLIMKPHPGLKDEEYKTRALEELSLTNHTTYFFENEPVIIHHVLKNLPEVKVIFMDSVHSGKADAPEGLPTLRMKYIF